jgi:hypothetical protein
VQHRRALVGRHLKMAAEAGRDPCRVAAVTGHFTVRMNERRHVAAVPGGAVLLYRFGDVRFLVVVGIAWRNRVHHLDDFPFLALIHHRALEDAIALLIELALAPRSSKELQVGAALR